MSHSAARKPVSLVQLGIAIGIALALTFALSGRTASTPLLNLGPITVADGIATVTGTAGFEASSQHLTVNGQAVGLDAAGHFSAAVRLNGASSLDFDVTGAAGNQKIAFNVPLTGALIPAGVLDSLAQAGVSLLTPVTGPDGGPLVLSGSVLDKSQLAGLSVNGNDVLDRVGREGTFSVQLPGTTKTVTLKVVDKQGVSETRTTRLTVQTVSASRADGVRIVKVRFFTRAAKRLHRVRMIVTVKDRRGLLIRGAKVSVSVTKRGRLAHRPKATHTGRKGRATVGLRLRKAALGKRLVVVVVARTPKAKARKTSSVAIPGRGHH
jgi:hypothetical protein